MLRSHAADFLGGEQGNGNVVEPFHEFQTDEHPRLVVRPKAGALTRFTHAEQEAVLLNDLDEPQRMNAVNVRDHAGEVIRSTLANVNIVPLVGDNLAASLGAALPDVIHEERNHLILLSRAGRHRQDLFEQFEFHVGPFYLAVMDACFAHCRHSARVQRQGRVGRLRV